ncbi:MAG: hypothetical protein H6917_09940 [Novosphingobium sp.]|nr:hypothetical protein [Novosphingobium sp.]MCP5402690.1 hypothetical protein [Novosphingobium sp.]
MTKRLRLACIAVLIGLAGVPAGAQEREVPYWASIRVDEVNMRVGPGGSYRVAWVYRRKQLPVKVVRLMQGWRLIEDPDGDRGWMLGRFLTLDRGAIVTGEGLADMREQADPASPLMWRVEPGVVGKLGDCESGWCAFDVGGRAGFVSQSRLWGPGEP